MYQSKRKKSIAILSPFQDLVQINDDFKKKPETFEFNENTMFGVDVADALAKINSLKSGSCRWPLYSKFAWNKLLGYSQGSHR